MALSLTERSKRYRLRHPERAARIRRNNYRKNASRRAADARAYYRAHREEVKAKKKAYYRVHREREVENARERRANRTPEQREADRWKDTRRRYLRLYGPLMAILIFKEFYKAPRVVIKKRRPLSKEYLQPGRTNDQPDEQEVKDAVATFLKRGGQIKKEELDKSVSGRLRKSKSIDDLRKKLNSTGWEPLM